MLCGHIPPAVPELVYDVQARRSETGSQHPLAVIRRDRPRAALFRHVHQPLAQRVRLGRTECVNVGHFQRTGAPARGAVLTTSCVEMTGNLRGMADHSTQSIVINAGPEAIMDVIADFADYPQWAMAVKKAEVIIPGMDDRAERVRFSLDAGLIKDEYVLDYVWSADGLTVVWELVEGQLQRAQHGSYVLEPAGTATKATYSLTVDLAIPLIKMIKRKAEKVIMDTALKELKRRVELLA